MKKVARIFEVVDSDSDIDAIKKENIKLKEENEKLNSQLIDLLFEANYNKQTELIEFLRSIHDSTFDKNVKKYSKPEILMNLRDSIVEFAKNNKIKL